MTANAFTLTATIGTGSPATTISLSTTSVSFPTAMDANSFVATITVTVATGTYTGTLVLGGADAAKFALSNGGVYPCNLMVGPANIPASPPGGYQINITAP